MKTMCFGLRVLVYAWLVESAVCAGIAASRHKYTPPTFNPQAVEKDETKPDTHASQCTSDSCRGLPDDLVPECDGPTCRVPPPPSAPRPVIIRR